MAKGQVEKKVVYDKIMETFDGAFSPDGKVIRIPVQGEDGIVEIKVALTAAKDVLSGGDGGSNVEEGPAPVVTSSAPSEEEKKNVADLLKRLGL